MRVTHKETKENSVFSIIRFHTHTQRQRPIDSKKRVVEIIPVWPWTLLVSDASKYCHSKKIIWSIGRYRRNLLVTDTIERAARVAVDMCACVCVCVLILTDVDQLVNINLR